MMCHKDTVLGLDDGAAYYGMVCDASYTTTMIAYWSRDRSCGPRLARPWVIKARANDTAVAVGLHDRGRIAVSYKGDLTVIDYERLQLRASDDVRDLPSHGGRVVQSATGYVAK